MTEWDARSPHRWDFAKTRTFSDWIEATFIEWVQRIPERERATFVAEVLDRYGRIDGLAGGKSSVLQFYQMEVVLGPAP